MQDIIQSRYAAMRNQEWLFGEKAYRLGNPFSWMDGEDNLVFTYEGSQATEYLQYISMFYDRFPTPDDIKTDDYEEMKEHIEIVLNDSFDYFLPFLDKYNGKFEKYILSTAMVRLQDYCFIKSFCGNLRDQSINHVDIGPGLGAAAIYSLKGFDSRYYALEAVPKSYSVQRDFLRFLSRKNFLYFDVIECENMGIGVNSQIHDDDKYRIKHIPSWHFDAIADETIDLVTGSWVLNEVTLSGALWILSNITRVICKGGYFYIRDGEHVREGSLIFDELLLKTGFKQVKRLNMRSRVDYLGIPRVYQKTDTIVYTYDDLVEMFLGEFGSPVHQKYNRKIKLGE